MLHLNKYFGETKLKGSCVNTQYISIYHNNIGRDPWLKGSTWLNNFWLALPEQRYWQNRETTNTGIVSSVGRAPARQSRGHRFKSCSSKLFFVHPKFIQKIYPVSFPCGLLHDIYRKKSYPLVVHPFTASSQVVS